MMSDEKLYLISGYFRVGVKAKTEDEALNKFNKMKIKDMDRVDINDMTEL